MVVLAAFKFFYKVGGGTDHWHDGIFEFADARFEGVAAVEEHHFIAAVGDKLVYFFWFEVYAATDDAVFIDVDLVGNTEGDNLVAHANGEAGELVALALGPLEVDVFKGGVTLSNTQVGLDGCKRATNSAVDAVLRDDDATLEVQSLAQRALPQPNCVWVGQWRELVIEEDLCSVNDFKFIGTPVIEAF